MSWESLIDLFEQMMERKVGNINTSIPGKIVSYDAATNLATVIPSLPKKLANETELNPPKIVHVPVVFPTSGMQGKQAALTFPIAPGDGVQLHFQQRSIEDWLSGSSDMTEPRQFDLSDCVAMPGLNSHGVSGDPENVVLRMDRCSVTLKPDNSIVIGNDNGSISLLADGTILLKGQTVRIETPANSFVLETHIHMDPQGGVVGIPQ